jgi:hypothetical protein
MPSLRAKSTPTKAAPSQPTEIMSEPESQMDKHLVICPYCRCFYRAESPDYNETPRDEACSECGKTYRRYVYRNVYHYTTPPKYIPAKLPASRPTPETDRRVREAELTWGICRVVPFEFSQRLERERDEARRERDAAIQGLRKIVTFDRKGDGADVMRLTLSAKDSLEKAGQSEGSTFHPPHIKKWLEETRGSYDEAGPQIIPNTVYERVEDMSPDGKLFLIQQEDGDIVVTIASKDSGDRFQTATVEFCLPGSGGGRSSHTLKALRQLILAIQQDNEEWPIL